MAKAGLNTDDLEGSSSPSQGMGKKEVVQGKKWALPRAQEFLPPGRNAVLPSP